MTVRSRSVQFLFTVSVNFLFAKLINFRRPKAIFKNVILGGHKDPLFFTWPFVEISAPSHFLFSHLSMGKDWTESTESTPSHSERRTLSVLIADFCCDPAVRRNTQMMFPAWALTFNVLIIPELSAVDLKIKARVCSVLPLVRTGCYLNHLSSRLECQSIRMSKLNMQTCVEGPICTYINWKFYHVNHIWNICYFLI